MAGNPFRGLAAAAITRVQPMKKVELEVHDLGGGGEGDGDEGNYEAMVDMAGEFLKAVDSKDPKSLADVMMAMHDCCASMPPAPMDMDE